MTKLELAIKQERDFQKRMQEKLEMWEYLKALPTNEEASKLIDDTVAQRIDLASDQRIVNYLEKDMVDSNDI